MQSTARSAIALTLFMFFLVILSAFFLLIKEQVFSRNDALQQEVSEAQSTADALAARQGHLELQVSGLAGTRSALEATQTSVALDNLQLSQDLSSSSQVEATLQSRLDELQDDIAAVEATLTLYESRGPLVSVVQPSQGQVFQVGEPVETHPH